MSEKQTRQFEQDPEHRISEAGVDAILESMIDHSDIPTKPVEIDVKYQSSRAQKVPVKTGQA